MTLDFLRLAPRIDELVSVLAKDEMNRGARLGRAVDLLGRLGVQDIEGAVRIARNANWLTAVPEGLPGTHTQSPIAANDYAALATDGSSIDVSRHAAAACYVINIGHAWMDYGAARVDLGSAPELEFAAERLLRGDRGNASKESVMTGNLLDAYRTSREMLRLAELAEERAGEAPLLALLDGQLILWGLKESELSSEARELIFDKGVLLALDRLRDLAAAGRVLLASFISHPASREVTNSLRLVECPRAGGPDCSDCPRSPGSPRPCDEVAGGVDRDIFRRLLGEGERSAVWRRSSNGSDLRHADDPYEKRGHALRFLYLDVPGGEIARLEVPEWMTAEDKLHNLQALVLDQCERGAGYPLVLQEAHEQAVIDGAARRTFSMLLEREMEMREMWSAPSSKGWSKRRRPI
jgi:NurA domain-containing protein